MKLSFDGGFTLVELLLAVALLAILGGATGVMVSAALEANRDITSRSHLYQEALLTMNRITAGLEKATIVMVPNAHNPTRNLLAFSGGINDDGDYYFGDPLFPRIDEDLHWDMNEDGRAGIAGIDDDGDGEIDEWDIGVMFDDDEDGYADEDPVDGIDNDGDGNIDEDCGSDLNNDGAPGIKGIDDDGDGLVDEGQIWDDDEDGIMTEVGLIPVIYSFNSGTGTLTESIPYTGESAALSTHVTFFQVTHEAPQRILIELTLTSDDGKTVPFTEYVCPRNVLQKTGKRVR